jgi:hypothetical protein
VGRRDVENDPHSGRSKRISNPELVDRVRNYKRLPVDRMMESELNVNKVLIKSVIAAGLGKRNICVKFVPH